MTAHIVQGNALQLPLPDESVDLIVTSPPYFALRSYQDDGTHYAGQIGSEETPQLFLEALWAATEEMVRVLKPSGSIFIDLGDKYAGSGGHNNAELARARTPEGKRRPGGGRAAMVDGFLRDAPTGYNKNASFERGEVRAKSLMGLPWRYALGCIDQLGLILRAELVWSKPNGLPESVTDRVRRSHEQWFHFVKSQRYFSAVDEIREAHTYDWTEGRPTPSAGARQGADPIATVDSPLRFPNPLGKLPDSVWSISSEPLRIPDYFVEYDDGSRTFVWAGKPRKPKRGGEGDGLFELAGQAEVFPGLVALWREAHRRLLNGERHMRVVAYDHFAAFPQEWPRRLILGWSPSGICVACGEGRRPVVGVDWSKVPHEMVERRVLDDEEAIAWCDAFGAWCSERGISNRDLDKATGSNGMGRHWTNRPNQPAVPTPEQWEVIDRHFGPLPEDLRGLVLSTELVPIAHAHMAVGDKQASGRHRNDFARIMSRGDYTTTTGYACACPEPTAETTAARILDPFGGTGTVALVAVALGREGISIDLSHDYCRLAEWRCKESGHGRKALSKTWAERQQVLA